MKNFLSLAAAIVLMQACIAGENDPYVYPRPAGGERGPQHGETADSTAPEKEIIRDVYMCVVKVPASYDWRRDTLFGSVNGKLTLLKNMKPVLDLKAGKGTDIPISPGMHHIADGHLYTEGPGIVKRDGVDYYRFEGSERIVSILPTKSGTFILSAKAGGGFCLRKDGIQEFRMSEGIPKSLYEDGGHVYFSYRKDGSDGEPLGLVEDGALRAVDTPADTRALAVRILDGKQYLLYVKNNYYYISDGEKEVKHCVCRPSEYEDAELFPFAGGCGALIDETFAQGRPFGRILLTGSRGVAFLSGGRALYVKTDPQSRWAEVNWEEDWTISACYSDTSVHRIGKKAFLPTGECVWYGKGDLVIGASDLETGKPFLWDNGEIMETDAHGYVSAVGVSLSN